MAVSRYIIGGTVYVTLTAKKRTDPFGDPAPYDVANLALATLDPLGNKVTLVNGVDANCYKKAGATGQYWAVLKPTIVGFYQWEWLDRDAAQPAILVGKFQMLAAPF